MSFFEDSAERIQRIQADGQAARARFQHAQASATQGMTRAAVAATKLYGLHTEESRMAGLEAINDAMNRIAEACERQNVVVDSILDQLESTLCDLRDDHKP